MSADVIEELNKMGIITLDDLDKLLTNDFIEKYLSVLKDLKQQCNYARLLRTVMILKDPEYYFTKAWNNHYAVTPLQVKIIKLLGQDITKIKSFPGSTHR